MGDLVWYLGAAVLVGLVVYVVVSSLAEVL